MASYPMIYSNVIYLTSSFCIKHGLIQIKVFHHLDYSNDRLSKIFPNFYHKCLRCHQSPATVGHMFWSCQSLSGFWDSILEAFSHWVKEWVKEVVQSLPLEKVSVTCKMLKLSGVNTF